MQRNRATAFLAAVLLCPAAQVLAQAQRPETPAVALVRGVPDSAVLAGLRFRNIGPAVMSGRVSDIAVPPAARAGERLGKTVYVASAAGGVWKTINGGVTWTPIFDQQRVSSIGAVAVAPSNANIVWVGTGESNNLRSSSWGEGIYKSTDAGRTWTHAGLRQSQHIARIIVHPSNPDIVLVAAMGPLWGSGGERGLYRTTDGGRSWTNVKSLGPFTGFTDVAFDPTNPNTLYAASYQRERKAYSFVAGGPESGVWKSVDGGNTWTRLTQGLPAGDKGRIGVSVSQTQPNTIYATVDATDGGIFRSDDAGMTWRKTSSVMSIPWFFGQIRVDPNHAERVYFLGQTLQVSDDGGRTFRTIGNRTHADHHAMWNDPNDSDHLIIGNDGGLFESEDRGQTWDFAVNLPISTFYAIAVDMRDPYWVYGGLQDNGTWGAPVSTRTATGIGNEIWVRAGGGDGFYSAIDPQDHNIVYVESQNGALNRFDFATRESKPIRPQPRQGERLRYNWSAPLLISPHDHRTLFFGANLLFRSSNRGDSWERISPDLTRALDRDRLPIMGLTGPGGLRRHEGTADFGNLSTIDESKVRRGLLYTGSDDGVIAVSRDGGANWTRIEKLAGVPDLTYVSRVIASQHNEATAYATFDGHRSNDFAPYVFKSIDYGRTWTSITSNLPTGSVYVIREHHRDPNLLVVGAEYGVFVSVNGGQSWTQLNNGLAPAPVHDLIIHPRANDLVVGTHGRGIYVMDDITVLERLQTDRIADARLLPARPATIQSSSGGFNLPGHRSFAAPNPQAGAALTYLIGPSAPRTGGVLAILDAQNRVVRELPAPLTPGVHRIHWDMRHTPPAAAARDTTPARVDDEEDVGPQQGGGGPYVVPGTYTVQLKANNTVLAQNTVVIRRDPLIRHTDAELTQLYTTRQRAYDLQVGTNRLIAQLEDAKRRLGDALRRDSAATRLRALDVEVDSALLRLRGPAQQGGRGGRGGGGGGGGGGRGGGAGSGLIGRINGVASQINNVHFLPTADHQQTLDAAAAELQRETALVEQLIERVEAALVGRIGRIGRVGRIGNGIGRGGCIGCIG